eukprot:m.108350 g.108350  ORF g.108350 m.108350 type:complete len:247 (+) comp19089_c0_seq1:60-800(+)
MLRTATRRLGQAALLPAARQKSTSHRVQGVLFDFDGTLTHTDHIHFDVWVELTNRLGYPQPLTEQFFQENISGRHNDEVLREMFPLLDEPTVKSCGMQKEEMFRKAAKHRLQPLPGLMKFIQWLEQQNIPKVMVTNAPKENVQFMEKVLQIEKHFPHKVLADDCKRPKPHPEPYLKGLEVLGIEASAALAFEDSRAGTASATAAKIPTVGVLTTLSEKQMKACGATHTIKDYTELGRLQALIRGDC